MTHVIEELSRFHLKSYWFLLEVILVSSWVMWYPVILTCITHTKHTDTDTERDTDTDADAHRHRHRHRHRHSHRHGHRLKYDYDEDHDEDNDDVPGKVTKGDKRHEGMTFFDVQSNFT